MWFYIKKIITSALIVAIGAVLACMILLGCYMAWITYNDSVEREKALGSVKFNSEEWKNNFLRSYMYYDLIENYIHVGMPLSELQDILGPTRWYRKYDTKSYKRLCFQYCMGVLLRSRPLGNFNLIICPDATNQKVDKIVLLSIEFKYKYQDFDKGIRMLMDQKGNLEVVEELF